MERSFLTAASIAALAWVASSSAAQASGINTTRSNIKSAAMKPAPVKVINAAGVNTTRSNIKSSAAASASNVLKTRHDTVKNSVGNIRAVATPPEDEGDHIAIKENGVRVSGVTGDVAVTTTEENTSSVSDSSTTEDNSTNEVSITADSISTEVTDASDNSDHSTNNDNSETTDNSVNNVAASEGDGATASGGDASYTDSSTHIATGALPGGAILSAAFEGEAIVNVTTLSSSVSGVTVSQAAGANPQAVPISVSLAGNAQQNFAGLQNMSLNTGAGASVIQNISLSMKPPLP